MSAQRIFIPRFAVLLVGLASVIFIHGVTAQQSVAIGSSIAEQRELVQATNATRRSLQAYTQNDFQALLLAAVNKERAAKGLNALCMSSKLQTAAQGHSDDMAANNYMSHTGADGSSMSDRITDAGYEWNAIAENVAAGQTTVDAVMTAWMSSSGHKANILSSSYTMFGCGYAYSSSSTYKHYWTQDFGAGSSESCDGESTQSEATSYSFTTPEITPTPTPTPTTSRNVRGRGKRGQSSTTSTPTSSVDQTEVTTPAPTTATPAPTTQTPAPTTTAPTPTTTTAAPSASQSTMQEQMLAAVNKERAAKGLSALCMSSKLQTAAQGHSDDMAANNYMSHTGADGSSMSDRITDAGYEWNAIAENVAAGQTTVDAVMTAWMSSSGHKANILSSSYTMFGCGYAYSSSSTYKHYWTQDFGAGSNESCN